MGSGYENPWEKKVQKIRDVQKSLTQFWKGKKEYGKQEDKGSEYGRIQTDYQHNKVGVCNGRRKASAS